MDTSYPWPSTLNVANFITVKPCLHRSERSSTFKIWRKQMLCLLHSQGVLNFVDGGAILPPETHRQNLWRRTDALVQGWILGSIGEDALHSVCEKQSAREIWLELENIFSDRDNQGGEESGDFSRYLKLYQAAQRGDCSTALNFFGDINELSTAIISSETETTLHVAVKSGGTNSSDLVKKLVELMPREALALKQSDGNTALHCAAMVGNTEAAMTLVDKNPDLVYILNNQNRSPVVEAAMYCQKKTLQYLISYEYDPKAEHNPFQGQLGIRLLNSIIASEFLDIALDLVAKHPNLALLVHDSGDSALSTISQMETLFPRKEFFTSWWQYLMYHRVPIKENKTKSEAALTTYVATDIENLSYEQRNYSTTFRIISVLQKVQSMMWNGIENLVPQVKEVREKKETYQQAVQLAKYLCHKIISSNGKEASTIFERSIFTATKHGISEIVEMIMHTYPIAATSRRVFLMAVTYRYENVINLFHDHKYMLYDHTDHNDNNLLHICAKLGPPHRLNLVSGAALQMQRELQWFKEMAKFVNPSHRWRANKDKQTPEMIFTEEHKKLKAEGERWMKETANSCSITAALIVTVMFAAAFTIPGGVSSESGVPILKGELGLDTFAHADAVSLFSSIFSLLMFLSILSSRYAEEDFVYVLPMRLALGVVSLIVSLTAMMVAFCVTFHLFFRKDGRSWRFMPPMVVFGGLPVASFALLQLPLLAELISSTWGSGIFATNNNKKKKKKNKTHRFVHSSVIELNT